MSNKLLDNADRAIRHVFNTPEGKVMLAELRNLFYDKHTGCLSNREAQYFLGQRSVIQHLLNTLELNDE